jgi:hypothetical protein
LHALGPRLEIGFSNALLLLLPSLPAARREVERNKFNIFQTNRTKQNYLPVSKLEIEK